MMIQRYHYAAVTGQDAPCESKIKLQLKEQDTGLRIGLASSRSGSDMSVGN